MSEEIAIKGRTVVLPFAAIVAIGGGVCTALTFTFGLAVSMTVASGKLDANAATIRELKEWRAEKDKGDISYALRMQRIEQILEFQFPAAAAQAKANGH